MIYTYSPDDYEHAFGTFSNQAISTVKEYDEVIGDIKRKLIKKGLQNSVNVIIMSDHGMTNVTGKNFIDLYKMLQSYNVNIYGGAGPVAQIVPRSARDVPMILNKLKSEAKARKTFQIYGDNEKSKLTKYRFYLEDRCGPIYVIAKFGHAFNMWKMVKFNKQKYNYERDHFAYLLTNSF